MFNYKRGQFSTNISNLYYEGEEVDLADIKVWLSGFKGGRVLLMKDESCGIAEIILDHPNKRNAMSGK